jgi:hypothetical protein
MKAVSGGGAIDWIRGMAYHAAEWKRARSAKWGGLRPLLCFRNHLARPVLNRRAALE